MTERPGASPRCSSQRGVDPPRLPTACSELRMERFVFWGVLLACCARIRAAEPGAVPPCPSQCHCEQDGVALSVDCSELGLPEVPSALSPLTAYL